MAVELLKEYGAPNKVAASYLPPRYLIGPQLYPTFITVLKIVLTVVVVLVLIQFGLSLARAGQSLQDVGMIFVELLGNLTSGVMQVFGTLVLVFAIIQFTSPNLKVPDAEWDPRKLKPVDLYEKQVKPVDLALELVFSVVFILLFNLYIDRVGVYFFQEENWLFLPVLTQTFYTYIPALTVMWALTAVKDLWVLRDNRWTTATRWFAVGLTLLNMGITLAMLLGEPIVALSLEAQATMVSMGVPADTVALFEQGIALSVRLVLAIILIGSGVDLVKSLYELIRKPREAIA